MQEIEVLVQLHTPVADALRAVNDIAVLKYTRETRDTYYVDPLRADLAPNQSGQLMASFRIRETRDGAAIAYKVDHHDADGRWTYSDEHETPLGSAAIADQIIKCLGLQVLVVVQSRKRIFHNEKYHIIIEEVDDLGSFLEVEAKATENLDPAVIKSDIETFIRGLGLEISRDFDGGKPELLLRHKQASRS